MPEGRGDVVETIPVGWFVGKVELARVLNSLYEFHLPVLSAERLGVEVFGT